jgi:biopolymer transport protein ExbB
MQVAAEFELGRLQRGLPVLATVANLAPLIGFLGTVTGMIAAFGAIELTQLTNPGLVAAGIQEALVSTAAGLSVAIPVQLALNLYRGRIDRIAGEMEAAAEELLLELEQVGGLVTGA